jgi:hypothetical protein
MVYAPLDPNLAKPGQTQPFVSQAFPGKRLVSPWIGLSEMSLFKALR